MDTLLSQLKGQGSPFSSPPLISNNVEKLLDTIHLLSQATVLVAHQLQEQKPPVTAKLPTPPLTPKPSPVSPTKKIPKPKPSPTPVLPWVLRAPEYYRPPPPNPTSTTLNSVTTPTKPTLGTPHTKKDRKPKSKRTNPSTQPNPPPNPPSIPATPKPAPPALQGTLAQTPLPTPLPNPPIVTPRPAQTDRRDPPNQSHPLPTPSPSSSSVQTDQREPPNPTTAQTDAKKAKRKLALTARYAARASPTPTPKPNTPPASYEDTSSSVAPANPVVNFPHSYDDCPRLPECPAHMARFEVYLAAYHERTRNATLPPSFPQPKPDESGFELRCERDTSWWPVPPSNSSSPPGSPADSEDHLADSRTSLLPPSSDLWML